jgi:nicotinamidase-related amidase
MSRFSRDQSLLLVVDIQEKLLPAMPAAEGEELVRQCGILIEGAKVLGIPLLFTEQYTKGLGPTLSVLRNRSPEAPLYEKLAFSALGDDVIRQAIAATGRRQVIVCGVESHVCVYQSVRALRHDGYEVAVPEDAVLSRREQNYRRGLALCHEAGASIRSVENILFELLGSAADPCFKAISKLVK